MNRAIVCTDRKRAEKFTALDRDLMRNLLEFSYSEAHVACAIATLMDALQGAKMVFHHKGSYIPEAVRTAMQDSWMTFLLTYIRHMFCHGVVVVCLMPDVNGRITPTVVNTDSIVLAQCVSETLQGEYAVFRRDDTLGSRRQGGSGKSAPALSVFTTVGVDDAGMGIPQSSALMTDVLIFEDVDMRPTNGRIRSVMSVLANSWIDVSMAQNCALRAASRLADPPLVMESQGLDEKTMQLIVGIRDNAATKAALHGMDGAEDLRDLGQQDSRATQYQAEVAAANAQRLMFSDTTVPQTAAATMMQAEQLRAQHNGMPNTQRVQIPMGQKLVNQLGASEPRIYETMMTDFAKHVALMFGVPTSIFSDRGMGTVAGDVGDIQRLERRIMRCFTVAQNLCTFFWTRLMRADVAMSKMPLDADGMVKLKGTHFEDNEATDNSDAEEDGEKRKGKEAKKIDGQPLLKRRKKNDGASSGSSEDMADVAVYLRDNPRFDNVLQMWNMRMLKWDATRTMLSQIMGVPTDAFVDDLKPEQTVQLDLQAQDAQLKEQQHKDDVRAQRQQLKMASDKMAREQEARQAQKPQQPTRSTKNTSTKTPK